MNEHELPNILQTDTKYCQRCVYQILFISIPTTPLSRQLSKNICGIQSFLLVHLQAVELGP